MSVKIVGDVASGVITGLADLISSAIQDYGVTVSQQDGQVVVTPRQYENEQAIDQVAAIEAEISEIREWDIPTADRLSAQNYVRALRSRSDLLTWASERLRRCADMLEQLYAWNATKPVALEIKYSLINGLIEELNRDGNVHGTNLPVIQTGIEYRSDALDRLKRSLAIIREIVDRNNIKKRDRDETAGEMQEFLRNLAATAQ